MARTLLRPRRPRGDRTPLTTATAEPSRRPGPAPAPRPAWGGAVARKSNHVKEDAHRRHPPGGNPGRGGGRPPGRGFRLRVREPPAARRQHLPRQGHPRRGLAPGGLHRVRRQPPRLPRLRRDPSRLLPDPRGRPRGAAGRGGGRGEGRGRARGGVARRARRGAGRGRRRRGRPDGRSGRRRGRGPRGRRRAGRRRGPRGRRRGRRKRPGDGRGGDRRRRDRDRSPRGGPRGGRRRGRPPAERVSSPMAARSAAWKRWTATAPTAA